VAKRQAKNEGHLCHVSAEAMDRRYWAERRFSMVVIEVMVKATGGDPTLPVVLCPAHEADNSYLGRVSSI
jgi:hypothetical protein